MQKAGILKYGFLIYGAIMATGILFVFIPDEAMISIGKHFNLPPFEVTPIFEYMARGLSLVSFIFGLLMFHLAFHPVEQKHLITRIGHGSLALLPVIIWIHLASHTPLKWAAGDVIGLIVLWALCHQAKDL